MHVSADGKLSVNKAALLWGISTSSIYKALDSGMLTRSGDGKLTAAEMARVFGQLKGETASSNATPAKPTAPRAKKNTATAAPTTRKPRTHKAAPTVQVSAEIAPPAGQPPLESAVKVSPTPPAPQRAPAMRSISPQLEQQLRQQIALLEQQLHEAKTREDWLKAQINELWTEKVELQNAKKGVLGRLLG